MMIAVEEAVRSVGNLAMLATAVLLGGCVDRAYLVTAEMPHSKPVTRPAETTPVLVAVYDDSETQVWEGLEEDNDKSDGNHTLKTFWINGNMRSEARWWGHRLVSVAHFDRRGRLRSAYVNRLTVVADLSRVKPEDFANKLGAPELKGVYIVGNWRVKDSDILALFDDPRIRSMVIERCRHVSPATLKKIETKLSGPAP